MVADVENQKKPLISGVKMSDLKEESFGDPLQDMFEGDKDVKLQKLIQDKVTDGVLTHSSLHDAVQKGAIKCLKFIQGKNGISKDLLDMPNQNGSTALLEAVKDGKSDIVDVFIKAGANLNVRSVQGNAALHIIVQKLDSETNSDKRENFLKICKSLLKENGIDLEPHGSEGLTPLGIAASRLQMTVNESWENNDLYQFCKMLVLAGASVNDRCGDQQTIKEVLELKKAYKNIPNDQRKSAPQRPAASQLIDKIILKHSHEDIDKFLKDLSNEDAKVSVNSRIGGMTILFKAVDDQNEELVKVLLENKADPKKKDLSDELAIHRAAARGHVPIFEALIDAMKEGKDTLDLTHETVNIIRKLMESGKTKYQLDSKVNHFECFLRLFREDVSIDVNQEVCGKTALHVAADFNNQEAIFHILRAGSYLGKPKFLLGEDNGHVLDAVLPETLNRTMDGCITHHPDNAADTTEAKMMTSESYTLKLNYNFLVPPYKEGNTTPVNEMEMLMDISRSRRHRSVIKHPLVQALLYAKWSKALPFYIFNVVMYLIFVILLTAFVYLLKDLRIMEAQAEKLIKETGTITSSTEDAIQSQRTYVNGIIPVLLIVTLYMVLREIFQICFSREIYLKSIENYLEWFLMIVVVILSFATLSPDTTRHLAAWTMVVAWYEFVLILGRAPSLALYIMMLRHVSWNFLKLIFLYGALIVAFTVSFNIILHPVYTEEDTDFRDFWSTLPKAIVMATGEFDYSDLSSQFSRKVPFMVSAVLLFLLFLFLIFLVLMNIMNGLAVSDTQRVVDDARLYSLTSRLELVYLLESMFLFSWVPARLRDWLAQFQLLIHREKRKDAELLVKINTTEKSKMLTGRNNFHSKLNADTVDSLRNQRLSHIQEVDQSRREDSVARFQTALQDLAGSHPHVLQQLTSTLQHHQQQQR